LNSTRCEFRNVLQIGFTTSWYKDLNQMKKMDPSAIRLNIRLNGTLHVIAFLRSFKMLQIERN
jgi:hypothetical protein